MNSHFTWPCHHKSKFPFQEIELHKENLDIYFDTISIFEYIAREEKLFQIKSSFVGDCSIQTITRVTEKNRKYSKKNNADIDEYWLFMYVKLDGFLDLTDEKASEIKLLLEKQVWVFKRIYFYDHFNLHRLK